MANRKRQLNDADNGGDWQRGVVRLPCKTCLKMPEPGFVLAAEGWDERVVKTLCSAIAVRHDKCWCLLRRMLKKADKRARTEREYVISLEDLISEQIVLASLR